MTGWLLTEMQVVLIQLTSTSSIEDSQSVEEMVSELEADINSRFGSLDYSPVQHYPQYLQPKEYFALLRVADLGLITSVRDGMNTASLEYIVCQEICMALSSSLNSLELHSPQGRRRHPREPHQHCPSGQRDSAVPHHDIRREDSTSFSSVRTRPKPQRASLERPIPASASLRAQGERLPSENPHPRQPAPAQSLQDKEGPHLHV